MIRAHANESANSNQNKHDESDVSAIDHSESKQSAPSVVSPSKIPAAQVAVAAVTAPAAVMFHPVPFIIHYPELTYASNEAAALFNVTPADAIQEFHRLMELKVLTRDRDATMISPTELMDHMWHAAILNTKLYERLQQQMGMKIHHEPSGALPEDAVGRAIRRNNMANVYRMKYKSDPLIQPSAFSTTAVPEPVPPPQSKLNLPVNITVHTLAGERIPLRVRLDWTADEVIHTIRDLKGIPPDQQRLIYEEKPMASEWVTKYFQLDNFHRAHGIVHVNPLGGGALCQCHHRLPPLVPLHIHLSEYNVHEGSVLHLVLRLRGC